MVDGSRRKPLLKPTEAPRNLRNIEIGQNLMITLKVAPELSIGLEQLEDTRVIVHPMRRCCSDEVQCARGHPPIRAQTPPYT